MAAKREQIEGRGVSDIPTPSFSTVRGNPIKFSLGIGERQRRRGRPGITVPSAYHCRVQRRRRRVHAGRRVSVCPRPRTSDRRSGPGHERAGAIAKSTPVTGRRLRRRCSAKSRRSR